MSIPAGRRSENLPCRSTKIRAIAWHAPPAEMRSGRSNCCPLTRRDDHPVDQRAWSFTLVDQSMATSAPCPIQRWPACGPMESLPGVQNLTSAPNKSFPLARCSRVNLVNTIGSIVLDLAEVCFHKPVGPVGPESGVSASSRSRSSTEPIPPSGGPQVVGRIAGAIPVDFAF